MPSEWKWRRLGGPPHPAPGARAPGLEAKMSVQLSPWMTALLVDGGQKRLCCLVFKAETRVLFVGRSSRVFEQRAGSGKSVKCSQCHLTPGVVSQNFLESQPRLRPPPRSGLSLSETAGPEFPQDGGTPVRLIFVTKNGLSGSHRKLKLLHLADFL